MKAVCTGRDLNAENGLSWRDGAIRQGEEHMKKWLGLFVAVIAALAIVAIPARAQTAASTATTASLHGKVINPAGQPLDHGDVKLTKDVSGGDVMQKKFTNSFPIGKDGAYSGADVAPGDYLAVVIADGKSVDFQQVSLKAGDNKAVDFDMTRAAYIAKMTPEEKKALEEYKAKNAAASSENKKIANLNETLKTVRADLTAARPTNGDVSKDVDDMKTAVDAKPDESILWITYGEVLAAQGDHLVAANKAAKKTPALDDDAKKEFDTAVDAFKKGVDLDAASKKPHPEDQAAAWNGAGNALAKEGKTQDAATAFESAVKIEPQNAAMFYGNEAAVLFNAGQTDAAAAAADKAIAADPNKPDPYFIKGQALIAKSTFDAKTQKITPPPGCVEAYQKYLELAPDGPRAESVKEVLAGLGEKVQTHYRAHSSHH
jgi:tetratricopeptide (TPR) repeat protein